MPSQRAAGSSRRGDSSTAGPTLRIRPPGSADLEGWTRLRSALWPGDGVRAHRATTREWFSGTSPIDPAARPGPHRAFLAAVEGRVVGFAEVSLRAYADGCSSSPVGYLEGLYVLPEFRRRGVARGLVRAAEEWAAGLGCREMASDAFATNRRSRRFHARTGYAEVERLVHFRKTLARSGSRSPR